MAKRITSVLLILVMLFSFVACADSGKASDNKNETTTAPADTTESGIEYEQDDLPDTLNFGGEGFTILTVDDGLHTSEITAEELNSDVINDSVYNRERFVEDRLGVEIETVTVDDYEDINTEFDKMINADDDTYQICATKTVWFAPYVFDSVLTDLYTVEYLDLEKPWWSQYFSEQAEVKGDLYLATGSLSLSLTRFLFAMFYNKNLAEEYSATYPELADIYTVVDSGDWTYDKFYGIAADIYENVNGDNERDAEDTYGIGYQNGIDIDALWSSFDVNIFSRTDDGWFELDVNTDKLYDALEKIRVLIHETGGCFVPEDESDSGLDDLSAKFADGGLLFMVNKIHAAEGVTLRNMQDEYGIIPYPKYDDKQKEYYSYAHDQYFSYSIPKTNRNPDMAGAVLEAMASYSYRDTHPSYLNVALKGKYMNDPQSRRMIDLIVNGFKLDSSWIYCQKVGDFGGVYRSTLGENSQSYAKEYANLDKKFKITLKLLNKEFNPEDN